MSYKRFDQALFDENDASARMVVMWALEDAWGLQIRDNPDQYGPDLEAYRNGEFSGYIEVEVKHNWKGMDFPFDEIHFLDRKRKFLNQGKIIFVFLNTYMSCLYWFTGEAVEQGRRISKKTKLTEQEDFIAVSIEKGKKIWVGNGYANNARIIQNRICVDNAG